jgi:hypothetical protein
MCEHLHSAEQYLRASGAVEVWRGKPWQNNCREWIYFNCLFDPVALKQTLQLDSFIGMHDYFDIKGGAERGLFCTVCRDGLMGIHPESHQASTVLVIQ